MNIESLYELRKRLQDTFFSGTKFLEEDFKLKKAIEEFKSIKKESAVLEKLEKLLDKILSVTAASSQEEKNTVLLDALSLLDAICYTQGTFDIEDEKLKDFSELGQTERHYINIPGSMQLNIKGNGFLEFAREHPDFVSSTAFWKKTVYFISAKEKKELLTGTLHFPSGLEEIHSLADSSLEEVILPDTVKKIDSNAFSNWWWEEKRGACKTLKKINFPESVKEIGVNAFSGTNLTSVEITGAKVLKDHAFQGCEKLSEVILNEGLEEILCCCFSGCKKLRKINIPESVRKIGAMSFSNTKIESIEIPENAELGVSAFEGCENLTEVILHEGIKEIPKNCFSGCKKLRKINIPESVEKIGENAFLGCPVENKIINKK